MKLTQKKKVQAMAIQLRNAHAFAKSLKFSLIMVKENYNLMHNPEDVKCIQDLVPKVNYFIKRMDMLYSQVPVTKDIVKEKSGTSHSDEISLRLIEALEGIYETYDIKKEEL
jgi:hypothetical protein